MRRLPFASVLGHHVAMVSWHCVWCAGLLSLSCSRARDTTDAPGTAAGESRTAVDGGVPGVSDAGFGRGAAGGAVAPRPPSSAEAPPATLGMSADCGVAEGALPALRLAPVTTALSQPTFLTSAPGDGTRLFVLERRGTIRLLRGGELVERPFLDIALRVSATGDQGMLGLAFHPDYAQNGRFFVFYASTSSAGTLREGDIVVSEFARSSNDAELADAASEQRLLAVQTASTFHAGGMLAFGPNDHMLYIGVGDGGARDGQNLSSWLGKILRVDVDRAGAGKPYEIPAGNMTGNDVLPELWSYGLRNPWRFSFDACSGDLYIGDVGENAREELDFEPPQTPGRNYGWSRLEGSSCFESSGPCDTSGVTLPLLEYAREFGCAVISGYVYRGKQLPALKGTYLYADYCSGSIASFRVRDGKMSDWRDLTLALNPNNLTLITSFGVDAQGELYVLTQAGGVYRIEPE